MVEGPGVLAKMALEMGAKEVSHSIHAKFCLDNYTGTCMCIIPSQQTVQIVNV